MDNESVAWSDWFGELRRQAYAALEAADRVPLFWTSSWRTCLSLIEQDHPRPGLILVSGVWRGLALVHEHFRPRPLGVEVEVPGQAAFDGQVHRIQDRLRRLETWLRAQALERPYRPGDRRAVQLA
jgi:hypothetical protein